jgi:hypothetical protein
MRNNILEVLVDNLVSRVKEFIDYETRPCFMDFECITPIYVYLILKGKYPVEGNREGQTELREQG